MIFTNGINLKPYLDWININKERFSILLNLNEQYLYSNENWNKLNEVLELIYNQYDLREYVTIGCNIHINELNYNSTWSIIDKYNIFPLRVSAAVPGNVYYSERNNKMEYYRALKVPFLNFIRNAKNRGITLDFDCNFIPLCFYTELEKEELLTIWGDLSYINHCEIPVDILSDHLAIPCFGNFVPTDYTQFNNLYELTVYFRLLVNYNAARQNNDGDCQNCHYCQTAICQGGCLAFSKIK